MVNFILKYFKSVSLYLILLFVYYIGYSKTNVSIIL